MDLYLIFSIYNGVASNLFDKDLKEFIVWNLVQIFTELTYFCVFLGYEAKRKHNCLRDFYFNKNSQMQNSA